MSTVMSAIGEATGLKPTDDVIAQGALHAAKAKATRYCLATLESATPELRHVLTIHLQDALAEHERLTALMLKKGWYPAYASPEEQVQSAVKNAKPALK